ncbi:hypothetical protein Q7P37_006578 [Cladosporium fusiforme]
MANDKTLVLITGANSGIGFEWAAQLMEKGTYHVFVCSRSVDKGNAAVKELQSRGYAGTCELLQLDQTDDESIAAAKKHVESAYGRLDVLINNAAIAHEEATREKMADNFNTNVTSVYLLTQAFAELLKKSTSTARVINVSSGLGSVAIRLSHDSPISAVAALPYRVSKTALSMISAQLVYEFKDDNIKVFTICPGFTVSNLGPHNTVENGAKPTDEAVKPLMKIVAGERDAEATKFLHAEGLYDW